MNFYPRSPCGERPYMEDNQSEPQSISIHALLAESDCGCSGRCRYWEYFYPRSPCGERREPTAFRTPHHRFLSTLSLRRATALVWCSCGGACDFYPRSPCGERPVPSGRHIIDTNFYPRSPCGERPAEVGGSNQTIINFYPRSPCGERPYTMTTTICTVLFLSTLSLRRATPGFWRITPEK